MLVDLPTRAASVERRGQRVDPVRVDPLLEPFTKDEIRRLWWLRSVFVAERFLVPRGQPCPDHQACRRLAFALWLRCSGRLSDDYPPETIL
jgi:hypothetical protein